MNDNLKARYLNIANELSHDEAEMEELIQEARDRLAALRANDPLESYYVNLILDLYHEDLLEDM